MKPLMKTLLMMLLAAALLAACGDDTASDDAVDSNDEATEAEETVESKENVENNGTEEANEEVDVTEEDESEENKNDSSGFMEDQQLSMGETGVYDTTVETLEITLHSVRTDDNVEGESPSNGLFVITEMTIKNVSDETVDVEDISVPQLLNDLESGAGPYWINGFEAEQIDPDESLSGEMVFDVTDSSSYFELVYGLYFDSVSNEVRWKFDADEIE